MQAESLVPLLLITAAILLFGNRWQNNTWADRLVVAGLTVVILRYLSWRLFETVLPAGIFSVTGLFIWTVFIIEILAWLDTAVLYAYMLRRTNRTPEADKHETRLRGTAPIDLPEVDIFIATYNEPAEVLEKTIVGAVELDWPQAKLNVWVLDDGRRGWLQRMSEHLGAGYLTRADNAHAKAGNIMPLLRAPPPLSSLFLTRISFRSGISSTGLWGFSRTRKSGSCRSLITSSTPIRCRLR